MPKFCSVVNAVYVARSLFSSEIVVEHDRTKHEATDGQASRWQGRRDPNIVQEGGEDGRHERLPERKRSPRYPQSVEEKPVSIQQNKHRKVYWHPAKPCFGRVFSTCFTLRTSNFDDNYLKIDSAISTTKIRFTQSSGLRKA